MERLTFYGLFCDLAVCQEVPCKYPDTGCSQRQVWERLKEIEDILCDNFDTYDLSRLKELVEADREGRCQIFPLKVGDTVYEPNPRGFVSTYTVISFHVSSCSVWVGWMLEDGVYSNVNGFELSALGRTVFLTREEAEKALKVRNG